MNLNVICIGLMSLILAYAFYSIPAAPVKPSLPFMLAPQQVGRTKHIQSKSGDASMFTEKSRRRAIIHAMAGKRNTIKETRVSTGSTNGSLETFFLTSIVNNPISDVVEKICYSIFDAGGVESEYCYVVDGENGEEEYDAGNANTLVCGV